MTYGKRVHTIIVEIANQDLLGTHKLHGRPSNRLCPIVSEEHVAVGRRNRRGVLIRFRSVLGVANLPQLVAIGVLIHHESVTLTIN